MANANGREGWYPPFLWRTTAALRSVFGSGATPGRVAIDMANGSAAAEVLDRDGTALLRLSAYLAPCIVRSSTSLHGKTWSRLPQVAHQYATFRYGGTPARRRRGRLGDAPVGQGVRRFLRQISPRPAKMTGAARAAVPVAVHRAT